MFWWVFLPKTLDYLAILTFKGTSSSQDSCLHLNVIICHPVPAEVGVSPLSSSLQAKYDTLWVKRFSLFWIITVCNMSAQSVKNRYMCPICVSNWTIRFNSIFFFIKFQIFQMCLLQAVHCSDVKHNECVLKPIKLRIVL